MTTIVDKSILVDVPVSVAYGQWTQFETFPKFMGGIDKITQLTDDRLEWHAEILGVKRVWEARVLEQVPDQKVSWAATSGSTNAGTVSFEPGGPGQTHVHLHLEFEPEGVVEKIGDAAGVVERQAEKDLERFKAFIESEGSATGAWRGTVNPGAGTAPGVDDAAASKGDSGKDGLGAAAVVAGAAAVAAAGAAVAGAVKSKKDEEPTVASLAVTPPPSGTATPGVVLPDEGLAAGTTATTTTAYDTPVVEPAVDPVTGTGTTGKHSEGVPTEGRAALGDEANQI
ncbi:SRPBCC family protein [Cellulomonas endophytica]|uniref:SRPBCC family protein n=1 Tax=Cellulomonas endophytica TaxID=2494735 RepID=UPI0010138068|nr:SRPBCC family protein [Cellulomonas endophytica]